MKERIRTILHLLDARAGYTTIETIAQETGAGVRTIHRDLERLERSLALRNVRLERRRGYGVRLIDPLPEAVLREDLGPASESGVDGEQRPMMVLLYLIASADWIKLSELANVLRVSDSSISSDIATLDEVLDERISIERQKGVGVRVTGSELDIRFLFLASFSAVFPQYVLVSMHSSDWEEIGGGTDRIVHEMGLRTGQRSMLAAIRSAEETLGLTFAPAYTSLVYGYLFLLRRRVPAGCTVDRTPVSVEPAPRPYRDAASAALAELSDLADLPAEETELLAQVFASCEAARPIADRTAELVGELGSPVNAFLERTLAALEEQERIWIHDDRSLLDYIRMTTAAAVRRIQLGVAAWRTFVTKPYPDLEERPEAAVLTIEFLQAFGSRLPKLTPAVVRRELREVGFALRARVETLRRRRAGDISVRILCYEGLGMSSYLDAVVRELLPSTAYVDATWDPDFARSEERTAYDLVVSTYEIGVPGVRELVLRADQSPQEIRAALNEEIHDLLQSGTTRTHAEPVERDPPLSDRSGISIQTIMAVIRNFFVRRYEASVPLLEQVVDALDKGDCDRAQLLYDFERRESYGGLVFGEVGIRLVHCRTRGVPEPRAGVLQTSDDSPAILVLAAPISAQATETRVLSELVVALTDTEGFAGLLKSAKRSAVRASLLSMYSHIIG